MVKVIVYKKGWMHISKNYDFSKREEKKNNRNKSKLTTKTVVTICKLLSSKVYSSKDISKITGATIDQVAGIKNRRTWCDISKNYNF